jgi:hypothetical protein
MKAFIYLLLTETYFSLYNVEPRVEIFGNSSGINYKFVDITCSNAFNFHLRL